MRCNVAFASLIIAAAVAFPTRASAQAAWDAPMLLAPGAPAGFGIHLIDPHPGNGLGILGTWRANPAPVGLGFRLGLAEGAGDGVALIGGVDVSGAVFRSDTELPVDVMWFLGAGAGIDDDVIASFPAGVSAGVAFAGDQVQFRPYVAPRIVLDAFFGDDVDDGLDLGLAVELGLDLAFSKPWAIRAAGSFGDRDAVSIGMVFPTGMIRN